MGLSKVTLLEIPPCQTQCVVLHTLFLILLAQGQVNIPVTTPSKIHVGTTSVRVLKVEAVEWSFECVCCNSLDDFGEDPACLVAGILF